MPFGLKESPFRFQKLCKPPLVVIRQSGFMVSGYLDDFLNCEQTFHMCKNAIICTYNTLVSLGFLPNDKKSVYMPCQIIEHLGHVLNSITMTVYLPISKTEAIINTIDRALHSDVVTIRFLCHLIGKLVSCFVAHPLGRLHYRSMECLKVESLRIHKGNFESKISLDPHSISDLQWWLSTLPQATAPINRGIPTCVFTSDASLIGWSGAFNGQIANGHFSKLEGPLSINCKELLAVLYSLRSHVTNFKNTHVLALSDSTTAISVVKAMGSMKNLVHDTIAQDIWRVAEENNFWISISHIPGRFNKESDFGSRVLSTTTEWALPQETFDKMVHHLRPWGPVIMDIFASRLNYKLKPYCSFGPDPECSQIDCFNMLWDSPYIYYANPPFSVLNKTIQHVQQQNATVMIVFPFWQQQMWFNRLLELLVSEIVVLPLSPPIYLPWDRSAHHPLEDNLDLCTAIISGDPFKIRAFQQKMPTTLLTTDLHLFKKQLRHKSENGKTFAWRGRLMPVTHL